jgi:hypothetical protein
MIDIHSSSPEGHRLDKWIARIVCVVMALGFVLVMVGVHALVGE